ncbi:hypothetical protein BB561_001542 [Smittium simulii]|uniref:DNA replication complex GINS protein PSF1 n=1 Tax=Smittium simulii TaxID=133385 RepID=A0A2T9YU78_9FUNG|nr:hypothetical protein BB561_001542 [Smittium simulii]
MLGDEAYQLAQDIKRLQAEHFITYNNNQVSLVVRQTNQMWKTIEELAKLAEEAQESLNSQNKDPYLFESSSFKDQSSSQSSKNNISVLSDQHASLKGVNSLNSDINKEAISNTQSTRTTELINFEKGNFLKNLMCQLILHHLTVHRNKRILLTYHAKRAESLRNVSWELNLNTYLLSSISSENTDNTEKSVNFGSDANPSSRLNFSNSKNLLSSVSLFSVEKDFIKDYTSIAKKYRDDVQNSLVPGIDLDWTADLLKPPRDLYIEVRVVRECGEIQTETGIVNLEKGSQHYLRRTDVENLIKLGYLQHIL